MTAVLLALLLQDAVEVKTNDGAATPQVRLSVTSGATTADVWVRRARLRFDSTAGSEGFLNLSSSAAGSPVAGDLRYDGTNLLFHNGTSWQTVATTAGAVLLAPSTAQTWTSANPGIFLNETGGSTPALLQLQTGGTNMFVVSNAGAVTTGTWNGTAVTTAFGGTGLTSSGAAGNYLRSNGTAWTSSAIQASDLPSGSANYIHNQSAAQQSASFWISSTARVDGNSGFGVAPNASFRLFTQSPSTQQAMLVSHDVASTAVVFGVGFGTNNKFTVNGVGQVSIASAHGGGTHLSVRDGNSMKVEDTQVQVPDGTAGAPGFSFINDTNTGWYRIGADTLGLSTSGLERVRINASGQVGINHTNPSQFLSLDGNNNQFFIESTAGGIADIDYKSGASLTWAAGTGWTGSGGGATAFFWYVGAERMYLTNTGTLRVTDDVQVGDQLHFPNQNNTKLAVRRWAGAPPGAGVTTIYTDAYVSIGIQSDFRVVFTPTAGNDGWWDYSSYGTIANSGGAESDVSTTLNSMLARTDDVFTSAGTWYACSFALSTSWTSAATIHLNKESTTVFPTYVIHAHNHSSISMDIIVEVCYP